MANRPLEDPTLTDTTRTATDALLDMGFGMTQSFVAAGFADFGKVFAAQRALTQAYIDASLFLMTGVRRRREPGERGRYFEQARIFDWRTR